MNLLSQTANGLVALSPREAQMRIDQLWRLIATHTTTAADETFKAVALVREIKQLMPVAHPENAYNEWIPK